MKRKKVWRAAAVMLCCILLCGCGKDESSCTSITLNGRSYNLADAPEKVIGKMVKNDCFVEDTYMLNVFEASGRPEGTVIQSAQQMEAYRGKTAVDLSLRIMDAVPEDDLERILKSAITYHFSARTDQNTDMQWNGQVDLKKDFSELFETELPKGHVEEWEKECNELGIHTLKDLDAKCKLPGFHSYMYGPNIALMAVFFDGTPVDLYDYMPEMLTEEKLEEYQGMELYTSHSSIMPLITYTISEKPKKITMPEDLIPIWRDSHFLDQAFDHAQKEGALRMSAGEVSEVVAISISDHHYCEISVMKKDGKILTGPDGNGQYRWQ